MDDAPDEPRFYDLPEDGYDPNESDSDSDYDPEADAASVSDTEEEIPDTEPSFFVEQTARLRARAGDDLCAKVKVILASMDAVGINLPIFLDALSWGDAECIRDAKVRTARTSLMQSTELPTILRRWWKPPRISSSHKTRPKGGRDSMEAFASHVTRETIQHELKNLGPILSSRRGHDVDEDELTGTSLQKLTDEAQATAPNLWGLIHDMAQGGRQSVENTHKSPTKIILTALAIISYSRSHHRNRLQKLFSLYFKFRGLSAKGFDTLHALGLTMSNKWTGLAVERISKRAMDTVVELMSRLPWLMSYDNATLSFRVFSQRIDKQTEFGNGTAGTVYIKRSAIPLSPSANADYQKQRREGMANPISELDLLEMSINSSPKLVNHIVYHTLSVLLDTPEFNRTTYSGRGDPSLKRPPHVRGLQYGKEHIALQYLLGMADMPEVSYEDNEKLIEEWLRQFRLANPEIQRDMALHKLQVWVGDQLTADRLRNILNFRSEDFNALQRLDWLIVQPGWLHIMMCFANSIHKQHLGTGKGRGLSAVFDLLHRKGLGRVQTQGPFFHDLDEVLIIVFEAQIRELWRQVSGVQSVSELRSKSPAELVALAETICREHASTEALNQIRNRERTPAYKPDQVKFQSILFLRDILQYVSLRSAIKHGDVGLMEAMLPELTFRFAGGKNSNYFGEMLEMIQGLKKEWTDEVREFVLSNCWLVNFAGRYNTFLGIDHAQEHNIKDIKVTHRSQGPSVDWKYLKKLHPAIHLIRAVADHMETEFKTDTRGKKHTIPQREQDIKELQQWYQRSKVHQRVPGRVIDSKKDTPKDFIQLGQNAILTGEKFSKWIENRHFPRSVEQDWAEFGPDSDDDD